LQFCGTFRDFSRLAFPLSVPLLIQSVSGYSPRRAALEANRKPPRRFRRAALVCGTFRDSRPPFRIPPAPLSRRAEIAERAAICRPFRHALDMPHLIQSVSGYTPRTFPDRAALDAPAPPYPLKSAVSPHFKKMTASTRPAIAFV